MSDRREERVPQGSSGNVADVLTTLKLILASINNLNQTIAKVFPQGSALSTTATAGTNGAVPAQVDEYLSILCSDGVTRKVPLFKV